MLKTRLLNAVFYLAILAGLVVMFRFVLPRLSRLSSPPRISSTPVILQQVQTLSQLVTVKWVMEKVVICDDPVDAVVPAIGRKPGSAGRARDCKGGDRHG